MSDKKRISRLAVLAIISALHGAVLLLWSRQRPPELPVPPPQAIPVLVQSAPAREQQPKKEDLKKPQPHPRVRAERPPHRKTRSGTRSPVLARRPAVITPAVPDESSGSSFYGIWQVRPRGSYRGSALSLFMRSFDCARLTPQYGRLGCPSRPVNLVQGMEDKIAAIAALEDRGIRSPRGPRLFRRVRPGSSRTLVGNTNTGLATSAQDVGAIPPEYPDPSFGD